MLGLGKRREFLLKLLICGLFLILLSLISWAMVWFGVLIIATLSIFLNYYSTQLILKKLDLGPEDQSRDDVHITPILERLSKKYEIERPALYKTKSPSPLVLALGSKDMGVICISEIFFKKLSQPEKESLLELAVIKIESEFCKNTEFIVHINSLILFIGSRLDLVIAIIIGLKKNKNIDTHHYILFSRFSLIFIRVINYFYMNKKIFLKFDEITYQNNSHLILALNKTSIYSPLEKKSTHPLLSAFNFCNFPRYVNWHKHLDVQPVIDERSHELQKDKNLMLESLTI